jgi:hypothetical protein
MSKTKVLLIMQGGIIQNIFANGHDIEVIKLEDDKDTPSTMDIMPIDQVLEVQPFDQKVQDCWKERIEHELKYTDEVEVSPDGDVVTHEFAGRVMDGVQKDTDGSYYVNVKDMDDNCFSVGIEQISFP